ncbi:hypothetical protein F4821DRAFT_252960 [Hypoxylon rubiginosum]|uniref:Uncharacterized protein n=1 Tax=Hypoxylon rubiginosum TaxID=110542 RepID=A0ACC0DMC6_9PEZI|nr:hypothetical protein F4821DRAFT_252960 [Hypoxylon rubiginosum]
MNHQIAKRYACDRCRDQKLRCDRSQAADESCERCVRMGAQCTMSTGRPLGRPSAQKCQQTQAQSSRQVRRGDFAHSRGDTGRARTSSIAGEACSPATANPVPPVSGHSLLSHTKPTTESQRPTFSSYLFADDSVSFNAICDLLNESHASGVASSLSMDQGNQDFSTNEQQFSHLSGSTAVDMELTDAENMSEGAGNESHVCPTPWTDDQMDDQMDDQSAGKGRGRSVDSRRHSTASFADILANIIYQLAELRDQFGEYCEPQFVQGSRRHGSDPATILPNPEGGPWLGSWDRTVSVTMRFAMVLEALAPPRQLGNSTPPPPYVPPTLSNTLLLLSAYVQLCEVFDIVLRRITQHLQGPEQRTLSHVRRKSSVPRPAATRESLGLHVIMMTQFVEKQLHGIEDLLGIPADCRMWSTKEDYAGIIDRDELLGLARDVIRHTQEPFHSLKRSINCVRDCVAYSPYK